MASYKVKIDIFEGPFELLVYLIEHARMSIYDIRISEITEQYLQYVKQLSQTDTETAQDFMVLAAELIELKSRMLLPGSTTEEQPEQAEDPRTSLVQRILEYKQFRDIAAFFAEQEELTARMHSKPAEDFSAWFDEPDVLLCGTNEQFVKAFEQFLLRKQKIAEMKRTYERVERERISVENKIAELKTMFSTHKSMYFSEMISADRSVFNQVVTFIGLLEMIKSEVLTAEQKKAFGDIKVSRKEVADVEQNN